MNCCVFLLNCQKKIDFTCIGFEICLVVSLIFLPAFIFLFCTKLLPSLLNVQNDIFIGQCCRSEIENRLQLYFFSLDFLTHSAVPCEQLSHYKIQKILHIRKGLLSRGATG